MKASIEDVARQAGVSTATVSRAFSRPDMVSAKTRAKVMEAAQQLDFSVSRMAGILKSGRSHRVALLVGSSKLDWFTSRIIEGLNEVLRSAGYDLVIQPIGDAGAREEWVKGQNVCLARRVAGVRFGLFECRLSGCSRCR